MTYKEDSCMGCATESYPCLGSACPHRYTIVHKCDRCKEEVDELYHYYDEELCEDCLLDSVPKVEGKECR